MDLPVFQGISLGEIMSVSEESSTVPDSWI